MPRRKQPNVVEADQGQVPPEAVTSRRRAGRLPTTPSPDMRTDPSRGTGELGEEEVDPSEPLSNSASPGRTGGTNDSPVTHPT
jgi:hypothetical protein